MTHQTSATPDYTMGFSEVFLKLLQRSTAETHAAYLLPYLRPGLRSTGLWLWAGNHIGGAGKNGGPR